MTSHPFGARPTEPLALLRAGMAQSGLDAFLVPRNDEHQGEYVPASAQRLHWLTGFSGSAGLAVALADRAALFVDGRYTLQAADEVDGASFEIRHLTEEPPHDWLAQALKPGMAVGYDPWLHTPAAVERLDLALMRAGARLVAVASNPLDAVWADRPAPPAQPIVPHPLDFAGRPAAEKRQAVARDLLAAGQAAAVLSAPDSIAWLLNVRGGDVPYAPLPLAFALIHADASVDLFVEPAKLSPGLRGHLGSAVRLAAPAAFGPALDALAKAVVRIDPNSCPVWVKARLEAAGAEIAPGVDPCQLPKACKTEAELAGTRAAHLRDGVAMARFLCWLDQSLPAGGLGEIAVAEKLDGLRKDGALYRGPSFPTISGAGANGAIVHYHAGPETERTLLPGTLYLVDSGGQYLDGTTDVTRTVAIGPAGEEERHAYTLVLKGHLALARARFPQGTNGGQLDALARRPLWEAGLDYDHGTGHGVGSFLSVHEGPQRISKVGGGQTLLPGMVLSNEPGYYKAGAFGIRIETLVAVKSDGGLAERPMLAFETLTLVPYDRRLIDKTMLDAGELAWIDAYHARVEREIGPALDAESRAWLDAATRPLSDGA